MRVDVMQHYGFTQPLSHAGYYETQPHRQLMTDIKSAILEGHLIALCGVIGSGKTVTLRRLQRIKNSCGAEPPHNSGLNEAGGGSWRSLDVQEVGGGAEEPKSV